VLIFSTLIFNAQESQEVEALKWEQGEYNRFSGEEFIKNGIKGKLEFDYDNNSKLSGVKLNNTRYYHDDNPFNRFFYKKDDQDPMYSEAILFTEKSIFVFKVKRLTDESKIKLVGCYGKKVDPEKATEIILSHLKSTYSKYIFKTVNYYEAIKSVELVPVTLNNVAFGPGVPFRVGVITTFKNGQVLKTKNLGGEFTHDNGDWFISVRDGVKIIKVNDISYYTSDCIGIKGDAMQFDIIPNDKFEGYNNQERRFSKYGLKIKINCLEDNSITSVRAGRFKDFDEIAFTYLNDEQVTVPLACKKDSTKGYLGYGNEINKIFRPSEPAFRLIRAKKDNKYGYVDTTGSIIIPIEYDFGANDYFKEKLICVTKNKLVGFINPKNEVIIPLTFQNAFGFSNGLAPVFTEEKWGYIDVTGKMIIPAIYNTPYAFNNAGVAIVRKGDKCGLISKSGSVVLPLEYDKLFTFNTNDYWLVKHNNLYGIVNNAGKFILPIEYKNVEKFAGDAVVVQKNDYAYGYFHKKGKLLTECIYVSAKDFSNGFAFVSRWEGEKFMYAKLNSKGEETDISYEKTTSISNSSYSGGSGKSSKSGSDKKTIKNTGRSILHMGADGSTGYSVNSGGTVDFPCGKKVYYTFYQNNGYNGRGPVISEAKADCGGTINANGDQYNKK
jgi:hypothetical protein